MKIIISILLFSFTFLIASELGWSNNYKKTLTLAKKQNKDIYILITSSDCI
ncbi:MAG: hypothetical protein U9N02_01550 [Campylobacterota bacterium]|nr:hypothetical protein [Campylobacterota bacterium]